MAGSPIVVVVDRDWGRTRRLTVGSGSGIYPPRPLPPGGGAERRGCSNFLPTLNRERDKAKQGGVSRWRAGSLTVYLRGEFPR